MKKSPLAFAVCFKVWLFILLHEILYSYLLKLAPCMKGHVNDDLLSISFKNYNPIVNFGSDVFISEMCFIILFFFVCKRVNFISKKFQEYVNYYLICSKL